MCPRAWPHCPLHEALPAFYLPRSPCVHGLVVFTSSSHVCFSTSIDPVSQLGCKNKCLLRTLPFKQFTPLHAQSFSYPSITARPLKSSPRYHRRKICHASTRDRIKFSAFTISFFFQCYMPQTHRYDCRNQKGIEKRTQPVDSKCSPSDRECPSKVVLLVIRQQGVSLRRHSLQLALTSGLGLGTLSIHLILERLLTLLLGLGTVDLN